MALSRPFCWAGISLGKSQRDKGSRGEREVAKEFTDRGIPLRRVPNSGGLYIPGDIIGLDGYHLEVKRQETLSLPAWIRQAVQDAPEGTVPLVIYRKSREPWRVVIELDKFIDLLLEDGIEPSRQGKTTEVTFSSIPEVAERDVDKA